MRLNRTGPNSMTLLRRRAPMLIGNYGRWLLLNFHCNCLFIVKFFRRGNCKNVTMGMECEIGLRRRTYNVLAGCVLSVWTKVEDLLNSRTGHNSKMQVVRLRASDGLKIVGKYSLAICVSFQKTRFLIYWALAFLISGTLIPNSCVQDLIDALQEDSEKMEEEKFWGWSVK